MPPLKQWQVVRQGEAMPERSLQNGSLMKRVKGRRKPAVCAVVMRDTTRPIHRRVATAKDGGGRKPQVDAVCVWIDWCSCALVSI